MSRRSLLITLLMAALLVPLPVAGQEPAGGSSALESPVPWATAEPLPESAAEPPAAPAATKRQKLPAPDFRVGDWEMQKLKWKHLRLNGGPPLPVETVGPQDEKGVPMRPLGPDDELVYNPTVIAQQGMKRLDTYVQTGQKVHLRQARKYADALQRISDGGKRRRWQPHPYDLGVHRKGWVNSNSHGLALSFVSRYYRLTGAERKLKHAKKLFNAFRQRPGNERWFSDITGGRYLWFEHWPNGRNDHTLNAHINALFGIYDYWLASGDPLAEQYFLGGVKTVRDKLYRFRRKGLLSRYSLASTDGSLHYHETHIDQLRILARMTGDRWFERQADRFEQDEIAWKVKFRGAPAGGR